MRREDDNPLNSVSATKPPQLHKSRASLEHAFELEEGSAPSPAGHAEKGTTLQPRVNETVSWTIFAIGSMRSTFRRFRAASRAAFGTSQ